MTFHDQPRICPNTLSGRYLAQMGQDHYPVRIPLPTIHWTYACLENHREPQNQAFEMGEKGNSSCKFQFWNAMCPVHLLETRLSSCTFNSCLFYTVLGFVADAWLVQLNQPRICSPLAVLLKGNKVWTANLGDCRCTVGSAAEPTVHLQSPRLAVQTLFPFNNTASAVLPRSAMSILFSTA